MDVSRTPTAVPPPAPAGGEVVGTPDGPDVVLPTGVRIRRMRIGTHRVTAAALQQAIRGITLLPVSHQRVLAQLGLPIELIPADQLEHLPGATMPVIGGTGVGESLTGRLLVTHIRVVTESPYAALGGVNSIRETTQHEIGHALAVVGRQDRSEAAAIRYAATY